MCRLLTILISFFDGKRETFFVRKAMQTDLNIQFLLLRSPFKRMKKAISVLSALSLAMTPLATALADDYNTTSGVNYSANEGSHEAISLEAEDGSLSVDASIAPAAGLLALDELDSANIEAKLRQIEELLRQIHDLLLENNGNDDDEEENDDEEDEDDQDEDEDDDEEEEPDEDDEDNDDEEDEDDEDDTDTENRMENFDAALRGRDEVPATTSTGSGIGQFHLDGNDLHYVVTATNLSAPITAAHFHHAPEGENGPVVEPIPIATGVRSATASGTWMDLTDDEIEMLEDELIYVNVHTSAFPNGEVRGQLED